MRLVVLALVVGCGCVHAARPARDPIAEQVARQRAEVEAFFGEPIGPFELVVARSRAELQAVAKRRWQIGELPCFAVAMGTGSTLLLLDPARWAREACDHARDGRAEIERTIRHELVHVFHGQHRPEDRELDHAEEVGWFVEGLATYAGDQLTPERVARLRAAPRLPARLAEVWTGPNRYGAAGTLVRFVDQRIGRARLRALLVRSRSQELLAAIGMTEAELLAAWRASLGR